MGYVLSAPMGKKNEFIRIRADDTLKDALAKAAEIVDAKWNDWRHTFASDLTMAGHSDRTVADLMGHRSTAMVKRYAHLSNRHLRHAIEGLANPQPTAARPGSKKKR